MDAPYRGRGPSAPEPAEPVVPWWRSGALIECLAVIAVYVAPLIHFLGLKNKELATLYAWLATPSMFVGLVVFILEEPGRRWLAVRNARAVEKGVAELEAKVAAMK